MNAPPVPVEKWRLWIDAVGVYELHLSDRVRIGGPATGTEGADIRLLANLSRVQATFVRSGEGYFLECHKPAVVDGKACDGAVSLRDGSEVILGNPFPAAEAVRLQFRLPSPLSRSARLEFTSAHRPALAADAIILMDDTCLLGPQPACHIECSDWPVTVLLYRQQGELYCKTKSPGPPTKPATGNVLRQNAIVRGEEWQFRAERMV